MRVDRRQIKPVIFLKRPFQKPLQPFLVNKRYNCERLDSIRFYPAILPSPSTRSSWSIYKQYKNRNLKEIVEYFSRFKSRSSRRGSNVFVYLLFIVLSKNAKESRRKRRLRINLLTCTQTVKSPFNYHITSFSYRPQ